MLQKASSGGTYEAFSSFSRALQSNSPFDRQCFHGLIRCPLLSPSAAVRALRMAQNEECSLGLWTSPVPKIPFAGDAVGAWVVEWLARRTGPGCRGGTNILVCGAQQLWAAPLLLGVRPASCLVDLRPSPRRQQQGDGVMGSAFSTFCHSRLFAWPRGSTPSV